MRPLVLQILQNFLWDNIPDVSYSRHFVEGEKKLPRETARGATSATLTAG